VDPLKMDPLTELNHEMTLGFGDLLSQRALSVSAISIANQLPKGCLVPEEIWLILKMSHLFPQGFFVRTSPQSRDDIECKLLSS
jgi:hypothetical protein